jgi:hypothetical protein
MATYVVQVDERICHYVEVEAETEEKAQEIGYDIIMNGSKDEYDSESEGTIAIYVTEG